MKEIKEADRLFSLLVRQEEANDEGYSRCVTCGKIAHWRKQHCGHFMPRQHMATRYDRMNVGTQCVTCNTFHEGRQFEFSQFLNKKYGPGTADELLLKSKMTHKTSKAYLTLFIKELKKILKAKGYETR